MVPTTEPRCPKGHGAVRHCDSHSCGWLLCRVCHLVYDRRGHTVPFGK